MLQAAFKILSLSSVYIVTCLLLFYLFSRKRNRNQPVAEEEVLEILHSPFVPRVSIIAPFNGKPFRAIEKVFALMALQYGNTELVMVVKKGGDILKSLRKEFSLTLEDTAVPAFRLDVPVSIFRSNRPGFRKFLLVEVPDDSTGSLLNAGLSVSSGTYLAVLTEEGLPMRDSLIRMLKPFLSSTDNLVACTGAMAYKYRRARRITGLFSYRDTYGIPVFFPSLRCFKSAADGFVMFDKKALVMAGGFRTGSEDSLKMAVLDCYTACGFKGSLDFVDEIVWEKESFSVEQSHVRDLLHEIRKGGLKAFRLAPFLLAETSLSFYLGLYLLLTSVVVLTGWITLVQAFVFTVATYSCLVCISLVLALTDLSKGNGILSLETIGKAIRSSIIGPFRKS